MNTNEAGRTSGDPCARLCAACDPYAGSPQQQPLSPRLLPSEYRYVAGSRSKAAASRSLKDDSRTGGLREVGHRAASVGNSGSWLLHARHRGAPKSLSINALASSWPRFPKVGNIPASPGALFPSHIAPSNGAAPLFSRYSGHRHRDDRFWVQVGAHPLAAGAPEHIRSDNGSEFTATAVRE